jgi:predicted site-specific integrase-resolvase
MSRNRRYRVRDAAIALPRIAYSVNEWCRMTGQSRASVYRQMKNGKLRFVTMNERIRRIPAEEGQRLGLVT